MVPDCSNDKSDQKSLTEKASEKQQAPQVALSVFEHYLIGKLWSSQASQALRSPASDVLIDQLIKQSDSCLLFNYREVIRQLEMKKS